MGKTKRSPPPNPKNTTDSNVPVDPLRSANTGNGDVPEAGTSGVANGQDHNLTNATIVDPPVQPTIARSTVSKRTGRTGSTALRKLEHARALEEVARQEKLLQVQAAKQRARIEQEAELQRLAVEERLALKRIQAEEARKKLVVEEQSVAQQLNLSQQRQEIYETRSSRSSQRLDDIESQVSIEKVNDWVKDNERRGWAQLEVPGVSKTVHVPTPTQPLNKGYHTFKDNLLETRKTSEVIEPGSVLKPEETPFPENKQSQEEKGPYEREVKAIATAISMALAERETSKSRADNLEMDNVNASNLQHFATRQSFVKDLPKFDGNPADYPLFISQYNNSNEVGHFTLPENLCRLQRALVDKSPAREAVKDLLNYPENVPEILRRLKSMFGQPEHILSEILQRVEKAPSITEKNMEALVEFSTIVSNLSATLISNQEVAYMRSPELIKKIIKKLPPSIQFDWMKFVGARRDVTVKDLSSWLAALSETAVSLMDRSIYFSWKSGSKKESNSKKDSNSKRVNVHVEDKTKCPCCRADNHYLENCSTFQKKNLDQKWSFLQRIRICYNCLKGKHKATECRAGSCGEDGCTRNHHKLLHRKRLDEQNKESENPKDKKDKNSKDESKDNDPKTNCHASGDSNVLFKIVPVEVHSTTGKMKIYAFLDEGSSVSLIDKSVVDQLKLEGPKETLCLKWTDGSLRSTESIRCTLKISGVWEGSRTYQMDNVRSVESLNLPQQSLNVEELVKSNKKFRNLPIESFEKAQPKLILGLEHYKLGMPISVVEGDWEGPSAFKSRLGWYVFGRSSGSEPDENYSLHVSLWEEEEDLHQIVKSFFTTENFGVTPPTKDILSLNDERCLKIFEETTHLIEGRYQTGQFWSSDDVNFPDSYDMALKRLECLERKFKLDPEYEKLYRAKMEENFEKGYARILTEEECRQVGGKVWYLPHFGVVNPNKPGKLRIVLDAAATVRGISLNSWLLVGPDMYVPLVGVLYMFREGMVAVSGDIREMFSRILMITADQASQRFLWRINGKIIKCAYNSLIFGGKSSPSIAQLAKNKHADKFKLKAPRAVSAIKKKHYVDDYLDSFNSKEDAIKVALEVKAIHAKAGFDIRGFISNSPEVSSTLNGIESTPNCVNLDSEETDRVLGMFWNVAKDVFVFKLNEKKIHHEVLNEVRRMTKREYLRVIMSLFDPMGLLGHLVVQAKIILQNVWRSGVSWDEKLFEKDHEDWIQWWKLAKTIEGVEIPRCYSPKLASSCDVQLHVFMDASEKAFSAVAYWRIEDETGVNVSLIGSKTKVAPLKLLSIPRLELQAAVLGNRLANFIQKEHNIQPNKRVFWSDSKTVLCWLRSDHRKFKPFVAFRTSEILDTSELSEWRWIPTKENVADVATKMNSELKLDSEQRWFKGPSFLMNAPDNWPKEAPSKEPIELSELRSVHHMTIEERFNVIDCDRFSCWFRLLRTTARVLKSKSFAIEKPLKFSKFVECLSGRLNVRDIQDAKNFLIRKAQWEVYAKEIKALEEGKLIPKDSSIKTLSPYLEDGVLRVRGRIDELNYGPRDLKRPIILPRHHRITFLIIDNLHRHYKHQYNETVVNELRQEFWIPRMRVEVRSVKSKCQTCKNTSAKPLAVEMSPLPSARLSPFFRPFTNTGLDYFGPVNVTIGRRREKRWIALFTCLTIRAVHLEVAHSLSADSCILVIRNFINRRGCPKEIHSDNGTNFRGASKELKTALAEMNQDEIEDEFSIRNLEWKFIPPYSPHKGGSWERMVRSVKSVVGKLLYEKSLREETLQSFLIEAENIVNSRPLTYMPLETNTEEALTPNHFLLLSSNGIKDRWSLSSGLLRKQWKISQELANHFWSRWVKEYAPSILRKTKWLESERDLAVGDLVVLIDDKSPRNNWIRGRVLEIITSRDGKIRTAKIETKTGVKSRSVHGLAVLSVDKKDV